MGSFPNFEAVDNKWATLVTCFIWGPFGLGLIGGVWQYVTVLQMCRAQI
jgi:hypothetical protein